MIYALLYLSIPTISSSMKKILRKKDKELKEHFASRHALSHVHTRSTKDVAVNEAKYEILSDQLQGLVLRVETSVAQASKPA